jgi:hypothetical protein
MSGREWLRIIEYRVVRSASGTFGLTKRARGPVVGAAAAALAKDGAAVVEADAGAGGDGAGGTVGAGPFFFLLRFVTVVQESPNGFPARAGKSSADSAADLRPQRLTTLTYL